VIRVDRRFASMGGTARVTLESDAHAEGELDRHAAAIHDLLDEVEAALSRFRADSELCALNRDPRPAVLASPLLRRLALAVRTAGAQSGGLVDATLLGRLERQGYAASRAGVAPAGLGSSPRPSPRASRSSTTAAGASARRWRTAHRLVPVAWAIAAVHVIGAGTDAGSLWLQVPLALTVALVLTLLGRRLLGAGAPRSRVPRRVPVPVTVPGGATRPAAATAAVATAPTEPMGVIPDFSEPAPDDEAITTVALETTNGSRRSPRRRATGRCGSATRPTAPAGRMTQPPARRPHTPPSR
jgi:hypothetical protein